MVPHPTTRLKDTAMATRTLPSPKKAPRNSGIPCHCCRENVPAPCPATLEHEFETLHGRPCCSLACKEVVDSHLLSDPPGVRLELINV